MKAWKLLMIFLTVGSLLLVGGCDGCGDDDDDDDDDGYNPEAPYGPPTRTTQYSFSRPAYGTSMSYAIVSEKEIGGETYWMANIGDPNQTNGLPMNEIYLRFDDPRQGEIGGGAVYSSVIPIGDANTPFLSAELDAPVPYDITGPVGEAKPVDFEATPLVGGVAVPLSVEGTYTLAEDDADVDTSIGTIQGCRHVVGEATVSGEGLLDFIDDEQLSSTAEAWYHDDIGFVAAVIHRAPYDDIYFDMAGTVDYGEPGEGQHMIQGMGAVDASMSPFVLDTYDVKGQLDADKEVHAKMILELRYVDEDLARTDTPPGVNVEFGTAAGYFGHSLTASPYSFFHPEENDQDFRFWIAYVDQAAKNEPVNGIAYHVSVFPGTDVNPVRATARIIYTIYAP